MQQTVSRSVRRNQPHVWNDRSGHLNPVLPIHGLEKWNLASRVCRTARPEPNAGGYNEIRAQYAGFFLAAALLCAFSLAGLVPRQAAFIVLIVIFGGLLAGRVVSLTLDGGIAAYGSTIVALYAIDAIGLALGIAALVLHERG